MRYFLEPKPVIVRFMPIRLGTIGLITSLILGLLGGPLPAAAQEAEKVYRIGLLHSAASGVALFTGAFRQGMREPGYVEGKTMSLKSTHVRGKPIGFPILRLS